MILNIYSDKRYLPENVEHVQMLYPFWGKNKEDPRAPNKGRYDLYTKIGKEFFNLTPLPEADVAVMPGEWSVIHKNSTAKLLSIEFAKKVNDVGKNIIIFFLSDSDEEVPIENSIIFRTSFYKSSKKENEFAMPAWSEDFIERYLNGKLPVRQKHSVPKVGFCGVTAPISIIKRIKKRLNRKVNQFIFKRTDVRPSGLDIRSKALHLLLKSSLKTNFIIRDQFLGGAFSQSGHIDYNLMRRVRMEYVQNMIESDYILCARGGGNFSYRLYETLSCGKIPIFINTDCVLPYDFVIDWKKYCVFIEEKELDLIEKKVVNFHESLSSKDFILLQHKCRKLWENWLSPTGFFSNLYRHFI